VKRTTGGVANITEAKIPGTIPIPKNTTAGIKYTNAGIVCIKSKIGDIIACAILLFDIKIPNGIPIIIEIKLANSTSVKVYISSSHKFWFKMKSNPIIEKLVIPNFFPEIKKDNNATINIIKMGGKVPNQSATFSIKSPNSFLIGSKKNEKVVFIQSTVL